MDTIGKLQAKGASSALVLNAPKEAAALAAEIQAAMKTAKTAGKGPYGLILAFVRDSVEFASTLERIRPIMIEAPLLWFAYPKKTSKRYESDLTGDSGWETMRTLGYSITRQIALDEDWSALRFVHNTAKE